VKIRIAGIWIVLALVSKLCCAQSSADSLFSVWQNTKQADSTRTQALFEFVWTTHLFSQPDSTLFYAKKLEQFSKQKKYLKAETKANQLLAITAHMQGEVTAALGYFEKSLSIETALADTQNMASTLNNIGLLYKGEGKYILALHKYQTSYDLLAKMNDKIGMANALNNSGVIYSLQGDATKALGFYEQSLTLMQKAKDEKGIASALNNLGLLYADLNQYEKAIKTHQQSLVLKEKLGDKQGLAASYSNLAACYQELNNDSLALDYYQQSKMLLQAIGDKQGLSAVLNNLGVIYQQLNQHENALTSYDQSIQLKEEIGDPAGITATYNNLGDFYIAQKNWIKTKFYCSKALNEAKYLGLLPEQVRACDCMYTVTKATGHYAKSLSYLELKTQLSDSIKLEETAKALQQLEFEKEVLADSISRAEEQRVAQENIQIEKNKRTRSRNIFIVIGLFLAGGAIALWSQLNLVRKSRKEISFERDKSDKLLLNILPEEIATELKETGKAKAQKYEQATILFTDFKGFTAASSTMDATELVEELNECFVAFDMICKKYDLEKIKTIGDAYMAVSGVPNWNEQSTKNAILAALDMAAFMVKRMNSNHPSFQMRAGLHTGNVVAGIVGETKFQYDIWGDAVNTASRMESNGEVGKVNVSEVTYNLLKSYKDFAFTYRGEIEAKGKGKMAMYFVELN
jgi:adenylate cyclase